MVCNLQESEPYIKSVLIFFIEQIKGYDELDI